MEQNQSDNAKKLRIIMIGTRPRLKKDSAEFSQIKDSPLSPIFFGKQPHNNAKLLEIKEESYNFV